MSEDIKKEVEDKLKEDNLDVEIEKEADKVADILFKKFLDKLDNQTDERVEKIKDYKKGKLYAKNSLSLEDVEKMNWEQRAAKFIKAVAVGDRQTAYLLSASEKVQPLQEGTNASGGFLVPEDWAAQIVEKIEEQAIIRPNARVVNVTTDTFHVPRVDTSAKAYWRGESAVKQTTTVTFTENVLTPYSLASIIVASQELLDDNDFNLVQIITDEMARRFADEEDNAFINGNGVGRPTGIDNYTARFTRDAGGALNGDHLVEAYHELPQNLRSRAVWIMHPRTQSLVRTLKDTQNRYLFELNGNIQGFPGAALLARPVLESSAVDQGKIFFIDLSYYWIADRQRFTLDTSREATVASRSMFERNEVAFRAEERVDGELVWPEAFTEINNVR